MNKWVKKNEEGEIIEYFREPLIYEGMKIYNPTAELLIAAGYVLEDVPEPPKTEPTTEERLKAVETILEVSSQAENLPDEKAVEVKELFPAWVEHIGESMTVGKRYYYNDKLWKVIQEHTSQADWTPDKAVSLYVEVSIEEFPEWRQPTGAHDAYAMGDKVRHNGKHWQSDIDNNVYEPSVYGWSEV